MSSENPTEKQRPAVGQIDADKARSSLKFFKIMAFVVGIGLLVLVLEMILKYGFSNNSLDWWPQPHGLLYIIYVAATLNLGLKMRWDLLKIVGVVLAGVVPFLSFWVERKVSDGVEAELSNR